MSLRVGDCGWGEDFAVLTGWSSHIEEVLMWRRAASVHWFMDIVCGLIYESCLACRTEPQWKPADRSLRKISQNILSKLNYSIRPLPGRRRSMSRQKRKRREGGEEEKETGRKDKANRCREMFIKWVENNEKKKHGGKWGRESLRRISQSRTCVIHLDFCIHGKKQSAPALCVQLWSNIRF